MTKELNSGVLLLLLVAIGLITLPHSVHIPWVLSAFFWGLWFWRLLAIWQPRFLPQGWAVLLAVLLGAVLLVSHYKGVSGREIGAELFVAALGVKLLELNKARDVYLLCFLALIELGSLFLFRQTILLLAYSLLVCSLLLTGLVAINSVELRHKADFLMVTKLIFQALPLALILFVFFPRIHAPKWALFDNADNQAKSGLGETLDPGSINDLAISKQLVFRVKFNGSRRPRISYIGEVRFFPLPTVRSGVCLTVSMSGGFRKNLHSPGKPLLIRNFWSRNAIIGFMPWICRQALMTPCCVRLTIK